MEKKFFFLIMTECLVIVLMFVGKIDKWYSNVFCVLLKRIMNEKSFTSHFVAKINEKE